MLAESPRIVLCGACMSGNIGGPALYISFAEELAKHFPRARITVLSKYPEGDAEPCRARGWEIKNMKTAKQLFAGVPLGLLGMLLSFLRLPTAWLFRKDFAPYVEGDVLVDMSGISFSDHRPGSGLLINSLWFLPAFGSGIPVVKASQAMGPFRKPEIRLVSRFFLKRMALLVARGERSEGYLKKLLPGHDIRQLPDSAFCLAPADDANVDERLAQMGLSPATPYAALGPSHVLDTFVRRKGKGDLYIDSLAAAAETILTSTDLHLVLIPHESKHSGEDDHAICKAVHARISRKDRVHVLPPIGDPKLVKGVCARAEIAVGSRFHFLVATLSSGVPSLAVAWSHKYLEMMGMVAQEDRVIPYEDLSSDTLAAGTARLWSEREECRRTIASRLPAVIEAARQNAALVCDVLTKAGTER